MTEPWQQGGFGLYLHWPFCEAKCPYCDFNSHVQRDIDEDRWRRAFLSEIHRAGALTRGRRLNSVFFGGGTPSLMSPALVGALLDSVAAEWPLAEDVEITLEANPRSVEAERFRGFAAAGVNRVSMGLQALDDDSLRRLGRLHSVAESLAAYDVARATFERVSFDLIYARQNQTAGEWEAELRRALDLAADHLSLYQLTIEPGTAFHERRNRGALPGLPDEDLSGDLYEITQALCEAAGLPAYEVSNHARPGAESRHNLVYWRGGDYLGLGPGAHGRLTFDGARRATAAWRNPGAWLDHAEGGNGDRVVEPVPASEQALEYLMMCLRLREGLDMDRLTAIHPDYPDRAALASLRDLDLVWQDNGRLGVTPAGRLLLNRVVAELLPE